MILQIELTEPASQELFDRNGWHGVASVLNRASWWVGEDEAPSGETETTGSILDEQTGNHIGTWEVTRA